MWIEKFAEWKHQMGEKGLVYLRLDTVEADELCDLLERLSDPSERRDSLREAAQYAFDVLCTAATVGYGNMDEGHLEEAEDKLRAALNAAPQDDLKGSEALHRPLAGLAASSHRPDATPAVAAPSSGTGECPNCKGSGETTATTQQHGPDDYEVTIACPECNGTGEKQFDKRVLFSSWQDPRSWDVNAAAHDGPVITCATNADAKKAEQLFNDLLTRAEKAEAENQRYFLIASLCQTVANHDVGEKLDNPPISHPVIDAVLQLQAERDAAVSARGLTLTELEVTMLLRAATFSTAGEWPWEPFKKVEGNAMAKAIEKLHSYVQQPVPKLSTDRKDWPKPTEST